MIRNKTLVALTLTALATLGAAATPGNAAPPPTPPQPAAPGVGDYGAPLLYGPGDSAPTGRINVKVDPNWQSRVVSRAPTTGLSPLASAHPRPYGGEQAAGRILHAAAGVYEVCTMGIGTKSGTGALYELTVGHCLRNQSGPPAGAERGDGVWYYPESTLATAISPGPAQYQYDTTGDQGALRTYPATWTPTRQVLSQAALYTLTAAGNPVLGENTCIPLGRSKVTLCGLLVENNPTQQYGYNDGSGTHGNLAVIQSSDLSKCPKSGDSGSPALAGTEMTGMLSASALSNSGTTCYAYITRIGSVLNRYKLFLAPAS